MVNEPRKKGRSVFGMLVGTLKKAKDEDKARANTETVRPFFVVRSVNDIDGTTGETPRRSRGTAHARVDAAKGPGAHGVRIKETTIQSAPARRRHRTQRQHGQSTSYSHPSLNSQTHISRV